MRFFQLWQIHLSALEAAGQAVDGVLHQIPLGSGLECVPNARLVRVYTEH
jgi:hypothetical protein